MLPRISTQLQRETAQTTASSLGQQRVGSQRGHIRKYQTPPPKGSMNIFSGLTLLPSEERVSRSYFTPNGFLAVTSKLIFIMQSLPNVCGVDLAALKAPHQGRVLPPEGTQGIHAPETADRQHSFGARKHLVFITPAKKRQNFFGVFLQF